MKQTVSTAMMPMSTPLPTLPMPPTISRPEPIWRAPRPSEVAEPKSVAKIAKMSMTLPAGPFARFSPKSGAKAELMSSERPLRKTP